MGDHIKNYDKIANTRTICNQFIYNYDEFIIWTKNFETYDPIKVISFMDGPYTCIKKYGQIFLRQLIFNYFNVLIS